MRRSIGIALWFALLFGTTLLLRRDLVWSPAARFDESVLLQAFAAVERGQSPYSVPAFYYPPPFAVLGGALCKALGEPGFLLFLRLGSVLGASLIGLLAVRVTRWPLWVQVPVSLLVAGPSIPIGAAIGSGNVNPLIQGMALLALALVAGAPVFAGLLLGLSVALKPAAAALVPLLIVYRPGGSPAPRISGLVAAATTGLLLAFCRPQEIPAMLARGSDIFPSDHNLSLARIFGYVGVTIPSGLIFAVIVGGAAWWIARRQPARGAFDAVATSASVLSLPMIWPHGLALTFPTQCLALDGTGDRGSFRGRMFFWLALAAVIGIEGSAGGGATEVEWPGWVKSLVGALPLAAVVLVTALAVRRERRRQRVAGELRVAGQVLVPDA